MSASLKKIPKKIALTLKCIKVAEWTCPKCNKLHQEKEMHPSGLLFCTNSSCMTVYGISVVNHKTCEVK